VLQAFNGAQLMGYGIGTSGVTGGVLAPITIPQGVLAPTASTKSSLTGNLDASDPVISGPINPSDPTTYSASVSTQVFDSLGNAHVLTYFFQNAGPATPPATGETWNWTATLDGSSTGLTGNSGTLGFDTSGNLVTGGIPTAPLTATPSGAAPLSLNLDFTALTQFSSTTAITGTTDGNASGGPLGVQVDSNGVISVSYSNGRTINIAQVAIATFASDQGLARADGGVYQATTTSGPPTIATAGAGSSGVIRPSALESSNVDTTSQLISLVVLQRSFQANSKALQTQDNILGSVLQLQTT
jgi:flagellar hook protein FlgE